MIQQLRLLKVWAGNPSYETIKGRVNAAWRSAGRPASELTNKPTVANCFRPGRRRLNTDLVIAVVQALHPDTGYVAEWRQALRAIGGEIEAVSQVRVQDSLPRDLAEFTGRVSELDQFCYAVCHGSRGGGTVVISAIEGMAGVGKTQLAIHAGHLLHREHAFDRVLFVNLRGFHHDPAQPPAHPAAVLDGFLRLLGVPGHQIPHELDARAGLYRDRLAGTRALVVLDNAATTEQVRPLLPGTPGCLTLVTSRRSLDLHPATRLTVDVFTPGEAATFLTRAVPEVPAGDDPDAAARIVRRCGHLPLALSLITGHIRNTPGWTLTDHADRLDERHHDRRLDTGVELALDMSYRHLPADRQRLLRLVALHPGQDFDPYAAAALTGTGLDTARAGLDHLYADHLLQQSAVGRYAFHDLVRAYATTRAHDEDRPAERHAGLTRLFDHYLATAAAAMDTLHPAEAYRRRQISPAGTPAPDLTNLDTALAWLDIARPALVAVVAHAATQGWPSHATRLASIISRYLRGGHHSDAMTVHRHAHYAARDSGDLAAQAVALNDLGIAHLRQGRLGPTADCLRQALRLYRRVAVPGGQADVLFNLGALAERAGRYPAAIDYGRQAMALYRETGDRTGESMALGALGLALMRSGRLREAIACYNHCLTLTRQTGDLRSEAYALHGLGELEVRLSRRGRAVSHLQQALTVYRQLGNRSGEAAVLDSLGALYTRLGQHELATEYHQESLTICRETGNQDNEAWALNGLGEAAHAAGRPAEAVVHHIAARKIATDIAARDQEARAHAGLGSAHHTLNNHAHAREHYRRALAIYIDLGAPEAEQLRTRLAAIDAANPQQQNLAWLHLNR